VYFGLIAEILLSVLAVFGLYTLMRAWVTFCLLPEEIGTFVRIAADIGAEEVPLLLDRAREAAPFGASRRLVALVDATLAENEAIRSILQAEGVTLYVVGS
jgi:hypothetical protein